jgi:hypothetical protein
LLFSRKHYQRCRVALDEQRVGDRPTDDGILVYRIDLDERFAARFRSHGSEVPNCSAAQLRILLRLCDLDHPAHVAGYLHRREDVTLHVCQGFSVIHLPDLVAGGHGAELTNRFLPKFWVLLALSGGEQAVFLARGHERPEDSPFHVGIGCRGVDLGKCSAAVTTLCAEGLDGAVLQLGNRAASRDVVQDFARPCVVDLPDDVQRTALYKGLAAINQNTTDFWDLYHSIQTTFQRRFQNGFSFGANYTLGLVLDGNTGLTRRLQHAADGTVSVRSDQAQYEEQFKQLNLQRHLLKLNAVWDMPDMNLSGAGAATKAVGYIVNDWQLSGIFTGNSGNRYDLGFSFQNNGANVNMTGSQDFGARIVYVGDPGSGCSDDQYRQFNVTAVTAPTYGSVGLESGRNIMIGCPNSILDLSLARTIRLGGSRQLQFRVDAFNALNTVIYTGRSTTINYETPTNLSVRNSQTLPDGSLNPARLLPRNAGFGAATAAAAMRSFQGMIRFQF